MKTIILLLFIVFSCFSGISQNSWGRSADLNNNFQNEKTEIELKAYPNPSFGKNITIEITNHEINEIQLTNIAGKKIHYEKLMIPKRKTQIQVQNFPNGIYILRVKTTDNKIVVKKLSISKK